MNCAPTGISSLNLDVYTHHGVEPGYRWQCVLPDTCPGPGFCTGIAYGYTNVSQAPSDLRWMHFSMETFIEDDYSYPILHDRDGHRSEHLETAKSFYDRVRQTGASAELLPGGSCALLPPFLLLTNL